MDSGSPPLPKAVVCHRGSRDYYEASVALFQAGLLETDPVQLKLGGYAGPLHEKRRLERIAAREAKKSKK